MLKHEEQINKMSDRQKVALLTTGSALSASWLKELGVPRLAVSRFNDAIKQKFSLPPAFVDCMVYSWDTELIKNASKEIAVSSAESGINMLILPNLGVELGRDAKGLSEDACLVSEVGAAVADGVESAGISSCVGTVSATAENIVYMDKQPSAAALREIIFRPYFNVLQKSSGRCVLTTTEQFLGEYIDVNTASLPAYFKADDVKNPLLTTMKKSSETLQCIRDGYVCLNGSSEILLSAVRKWRDMVRGVRGGTVSVAEVAAAEKGWEVVSEETLNTAVDKVIDFLFACDKRMSHPSAKKEVNKKVIRQVYERSFVLLKNFGGVLPVGRGRSVALLGDMPISDVATHAFANRCKANRIKFAGYAPAYDRAKETGDKELLSKAVSLARSADVSVVFLTPRDGEDRLAANRYELLYKLKTVVRKPVVAVLLSDRTDVDFAKWCNGLVLANVVDETSAEALADMLFGVYAPSGRLVKNLYSDRKKYFDDLLIRREKTGVGRYYGYRYTETFMPSLVAYPFGYGLSYGSVKYGKLKIIGNSLFVTLTNKSRYTARETVQVYVAASESSFPIPAKTLVAFKNVAVPPNRSVNAKIELNSLKENLKVYDPPTRRLFLEDGEYTLIVGSSVRDESLKRTVHILGRIFVDKEAIGKPPAPPPNVKSEGYYLGKSEPPETKTMRRILIGFTAFAAAIAIFTLALIVKYPSSWFYFLIFIAGVALATAFADVYAIRRKRLRKKAMEIANNSTAGIDNLWSERPVEGAVHLDQLFPEEPVPKVDEIKISYMEEEEAVLSSSGIKLDGIYTNLIYQMARNSLAATPTDAKKIISSLAATRLMMLRNKEIAQTAPLLRSLSEFFGSEHFRIEASQFKTAADYFKPEGGILPFLDYAAKNKEKVVILSVFNADKDGLKGFFKEMVPFFSNPARNAEVQPDGVKKKVIIPDNVWFIYVGGEVSVKVPAFVSSFASVTSVAITAREREERAVVYDSPSAKEFTTLVNTARDTMDVDEAIWRGVDRIEDFVNKKTLYGVDNIKWGQIERYMAAYLACENSSGNEASAEALDCALATELMINAANALSGKIAVGEDTFLQCVERSLGEDKCSNCVEILKTIDEKGIAR